MAQTLQPTVWRTCRVLANSSRLKIFALLVRERGLTVSSVATQLRLALPVASLYLRALEARGMLVSERTGRWVTYEVAAPNSPVGSLASALRSSVTRDPKFVQSTFKVATAFTHPRRRDVFRSLKHPQTMAELKASTGIPERALLRHLQKLKTRGFVVYRRGRPGTYVARDQPTAVGRALAQLASPNG